MELPDGERTWGGGRMSGFYSSITVRSKGAWVVHHGQKTRATTGGAAEFSAIDTAGKAAALLSQITSSNYAKIEKSQVVALAKSAGINPKLELPEILNLLERKRLIERATNGDFQVVGLTSAVNVQYAAEIFEELEPSPEELASIAVAELSSAAPARHERLREFIGDEFRMTTETSNEFLSHAVAMGFIDAEGRNADRVYFNGNLFRRDRLEKTTRVLASLSEADAKRIAEIDQSLKSKGCLSVRFVIDVLGEALFEKTRAAGMYDVNIVTNPSGEYGYVTKPDAFHKFNDPYLDDSFDLAKALVAALSYGMTQSSRGRGRIEMIQPLLSKLIVGGVVGPSTAIGEDYKILETKGVIRVTKAPPPRVGYFMKLRKPDIGKMALRVLTIGETSSLSSIERPFAGKMSGYVGPEASRWEFRQRQSPESKAMTHDVLEALRTGGDF